MPQIARLTIKLVGDTYTVRLHRRAARGRLVHLATIKGLTRDNLHDGSLAGFVGKHSQSFDNPAAA